MNLQQLKNITCTRGIRRDEIARMAGDSRAAVTRWFAKGEKNGRLNIETDSLVRLSKGLKIDPALLLKETDDLSRFKTSFLWDRLYPEMESFVQALSQKRAVAMARLVQVLGFQSARKILGRSVLSQFDRYKQFIKPVRRRELELLWPLYR